MVKHWDQEKTRNIAEKNSSNRKLKEHGHEPDHIQFFYEKHTRNDGQKSFSDKVYEEAYGKMQDKLDELVTVEGDGRDATHEMWERAYFAVMGPKTRYTVRGYGRGVTPEMVSYCQTDDRSSNQRARKRSYEALQS